MPRRSALPVPCSPPSKPAAVALWRSIVAVALSGTQTNVKRRVKPEPAGAASDAVSGYVRPDTDVPNHTLGEAVFRCGSYLQRSGALVGFHGSMGEGMPDADPARGGYSALRCSGAMNLLELVKVHRAGLV